MRRIIAPRLFAVFLALAWVALASAAQALTSDVTVLRFDNPAARACVEAARRGDASDAALAHCDDALKERGRARELIALQANRGVLRMRRGQFAEALEDFDAVLARTPQDPDLLINRGVALIRLNRAAEAVPTLTSALQAGPADPHKAYYNRGAAREQLGDLRGALEDYETALAIKPDWDIAEREIRRFVEDRRRVLADRLGPPDVDPEEPAEAGG